MTREMKEQKKRKHFKQSRIGRRLEKLRLKSKDLWLDESSESENEKKTFSSIKQRINPTCLICSILSQLSSHNCCSNHLNILKNHDSHQTWLSDRVMIVPLSSEIVQKYLNSEQNHRLPTVNEPEKSSTNDLPTIASTITIETPPLDPWQPITDDVDAALEQVLNQVDSELEYSPHTVRHTDTTLLANRLPKIPLKEGRFRHGRPIQKQIADNAANEYRPLAAVLSSSPESSTMAIDRTRPLETSRANTPTRIQIRTNPDGTRVSVSRPLLQPNQQSPLTTSLRRTSTDIEPSSKQV